MPRNPSPVDAYLKGLDPTRRQTLQRVRDAIRSAAPDAEECLSYGLPAFRHSGRALVAYGAAAAHCALYPMSGTILATFAAELKPYSTSKGTIRFPVDRPLPKSLVRKLVRARMKENAAAGNTTPPRARKTSRAQPRATGRRRSNPASDAPSASGNHRRRSTASAKR